MKSVVHNIPVTNQEARFRAYERYQFKAILYYFIAMVAPL